MKKLTVITAVLLLLAGAGVGGWWYLLREAPGPADHETAAEGPPAFLTLPAITVPVIGNDRVSRVFAFQITLELVSAEYQSDAKAALPRLIDAFLSELHGLLGRRLMEERGYDLELVNHRLKAAAEGVLGAGRVADILIRMVDRR